MSTVLACPRLKYPGPRPIVRDGMGNGRAQWDWFYMLPTREQNRLRYYMSADGCEPDEWAATMDYDDVESAMVYWQGLVAEVRGEWDEWADQPEPEQLAELVREQVLGLQEIAARLGVKVCTAHKWRARHLLPDPDIVISGAPIWWAGTIDAWAEETGRA